MKRLLFLAAAAGVLVLAAVTGGRAAQAQEATPTPPPPPPADVYMATPSTCLAIHGVAAALDCVKSIPPAFLGSQRSIITADFDTNDDGTLTRAEVGAMDAFTHHEMHQTDGAFIVAFVDFNRAVTFRTTRGLLQVTGSGQEQQFTCNQPASVFTMAGDDDCVVGGPRGDGVVYAQLVTNNTPVGDGTVFVTDANTGEAIGQIDFHVVGAGWTDSIQGFDTKVQGEVAPADCLFPASTAGFVAALADPGKTVILVHIQDVNGNDVAGSWVHVTVDDPTKATVALPDSPSLDLGSFGLAAPNVICGRSGPADVKVTATIEIGPQNISVDGGAAPSAGTKATTDLSVVGNITTLNVVVDPASQACDGTTTSTVTATALDSAGNTAAPGVEVLFDTQVLGTANPVIGKTGGDGVSTSVITPLAADESGDPVVVAAGDAVSSVLISCTGAAAAPPPPPPAAGNPPPTGSTGGSGTPPTGITGPNTGSGPIGAQGAGSLPWWPVLGLFAAAIVLVAGRKVIAEVTEDEDRAA